MRSPRRIDSEDLPFKKLRNEMDGMFQRFFEDPFFTNRSADTHLRPAANVVEEKDRYVIEVEIPGVNPEQVEIEVDGSVLKIKGERKQRIQYEDKETEVHTVEHHYGSFARSFTLPDGINDEAISAHDENGILFIEIPKTKETKARRIQINKKTK